jgi:hypothetical protein
MAFVDVVSKTGAEEPEQKDAIAAKVVVVAGITVTVDVAAEAQEPANGVKVYVPEAVLLTVDGDQVPVITLFDTVGKTGAIAPLQISELASNNGVTKTEETVTVCE